ncbi:MAG: cytochrome c family protein [Roseovarius sp.]|nr:cytochrome c family protein [Roseovarius sp.]
MFDTMTLTKIVGAFCGALLVFMLAKYASENVYAMESGHGSDDGEVHVAYLIDTGDSGNAVEEADEGPSFEVLLAEADVGKGQRVFGKCKACHKLEAGANSTGPYLLGIVGRNVDGVADFAYSGALGAVADVWSPVNLDSFLESPKKFAPGTSMAFAGLRKPEDRANLIAYLDSLGN